MAHFPWDPALPPQPEPVTKKHAAQQHLPAQVKKEPGVNMNMQQQTLQDGPRIKTEPGLEPQGISAPPLGNPSFNPKLAAMRAQQNIQQKFGGAAVPILVQQPQQQRHGPPKPSGGGLMLPGISQIQQNGLPQHDGSDDFYNNHTSLEGRGNISREQADKVILKQVGTVEKRKEELVAAMQRAGSKMSVANKRRRPDAYEAALSSDTSYPYSSPVTLSNHVELSQLDGGSSAEPDDDEDAINSDLDDPEDEDIANQDEDEIPLQVMLCMYDKVQRTRNKWKCVLKDGVLTIEGKE